MTRKEFVLNVVEEMVSNPRAILAGHGISATVLQQIIERPDIMAKMAVTLYSTKYAKKGAKGMKKSNNFQIKGYKNFPDFNLKAREDIEKYVGQLPPKDQESFTNSDNILCIYAEPDNEVANSDKTDSETLSSDMIAGKSIVKTFDNAVKKEQAKAGGFYITIMIGESAVRVPEAKAAKRLSKKNKRKDAKRTPARMKAEMKSKANKKLANLNKAGNKLREKAMRLQAQSVQFAQIGRDLGIDSGDIEEIMSGVESFDKGTLKYDRKIKRLISKMSVENKAMYNQAVKYMKAGKTTIAKTLLKEINIPELTNFLLKEGGKVDKTGILDARKKAIRNEIRKLTRRSEQLLVDLSLAPDVSKKRSVKSMISKNSSKIKQLRLKLGTYKNISAKGMKTKAELLATVNADIESNIAAGNDIQTALNDAIEKINAGPKEKQIIKQQIIAQVAEGTPMQYAVQQSIQENIKELDSGTNLAGDSSTVEDIMSML